MAYNEKLADKVREALADQKKVEEKVMFRGVCFMVNGKMCVCVSEDELMCRVGPDAYEAALEQPGCRPMIHGTQTMKGFVYVDHEALRTKKQFDHWLTLSLAFNKQAKATKKKKKL
jgi:TfoX/Sxy family transcriptional regulator of competence genes